MCKILLVKTLKKYFSVNLCVFLQVGRFFCQLKIWRVLALHKSLHTTTTKMFFDCYLKTHTYELTAKLCISIRACEFFCQVLNFSASLCIFLWDMHTYTENIFSVSSDNFLNVSVRWWIFLRCCEFSVRYWYMLKKSGSSENFFDFSVRLAIWHEIVNLELRYKYY